jgi:hypothetical protein
LYLAITVQQTIVSVIPVRSVERLFWAAGAARFRSTGPLARKLWRVARASGDNRRAGPAAGYHPCRRSARLQTVKPEGNPLFHRLITCFGKIAGVHCVVNTSFTGRGQAMTGSPEIALSTFLKVRIDRLYLGSFRVEKQRQP